MLVQRAALASEGHLMNLTSEERSRLIGLLREGYGLEDAAVKLRVPLEDVRACIACWRQQNQLRRYLGKIGYWSRARNREALEIMGVSHE